MEEAFTDAARVIREARGRAGLTQRALARAAGMPQPAIARIETGDVVPRVDTLARVLEACGFGLAVQPKPRETERLARSRAEIRSLLRLSPRQRLMSLTQKAGARFRPLEQMRILSGRHVNFVVVDEIAARLHGAPLTPDRLEVGVRPEHLNGERLARALEAMTRTSGRPGKGIPAGLRDLRGRGKIRNRLGTIEVWWPTEETYRRLEGAATQMKLDTRPVLVASIDDVIERWRGRRDEIGLLTAVREEMDLRATARVRGRR